MAVKEVVFFNGMKMPIVGLGTWQSTEDEVSTAIETALEAGYKHIDTAYLYKNEAAIGKTLKKWFDSGRIKREDLFIVTKLPLIGNRAESVEKYLKRSLAALQLDYVDLYLIHHPVGVLEKGEDLWPSDDNGKLLVDMSTDHISLWKTMEAQVDAGRTKSIGLSNFNARQIKRIVKSARIQPANLQVELHVYFQQRELAAFCKALDVTVCAYSPLGSPGLVDFLKKSGRDSSGIPNLSPLTDSVVAKIANKYNRTPAQVLLRHIVQRGIVVIPKSVTPNRIKENFDVFDFQLSNDDVKELDALDLRECGRMFNDKASGRARQHGEEAKARRPSVDRLLPAARRPYEDVMAAGREVVFFNGHQMPIVGLGTWQSSEADVLKALDAALEIGYRHIDTAYMYQNEAAIGRCLRKWFESGRVKREDLFIVTKLPPIGNHCSRVEKYLRRSLTSLQLNYVDLYLIHHPVGMHEKGEELWPADDEGKLLVDHSTDHISIWKAMEAQVDAGRARSIGLSNFSSRQIKRIVKNARIRPANLQIELHAYFRQRELVAFCSALDITICAYAPLGSPGLVSWLKGRGSDTSGISDLSPLTESVVQNIAKKHGKSPAQILLRHIIQKGIAVIPKSVHVKRIKENFEIFDFLLNKEEVLALDDLDLGSKARMFGDRSASRFADHPENPFVDPY